jgi:hypothetical protein
MCKSVKDSFIAEDNYKLLGLQVCNFVWRHYKHSYKFFVNTFSKLKIIKMVGLINFEVKLNDKFTPVLN